MARFFREDFDRNRDFVVNKDFTFAGQGFVSGPKPIDKSLFSVRRLRQLYDMRKLEHAPIGTVYAQPEVKVTPTSGVARYRPKVERHRVGSADGIAP